MVGINNSTLCVCTDLNISESVIKEYFNEILNKVPNSINGSNFSNILGKYLKSLQNQKPESLDGSIKIRKTLSEYIIQNSLDKDNIYILDKDSWKDASTVLIIEQNQCDNKKLNLSFNLW